VIVLTGNGASPKLFMKSLANFEEGLLAVVANRLFVFDMDGTLLIGTTACIEIAKMSGTLGQLHVLEEQFGAGEIDAFCFAQNIGALWGMVDEHVVRAAFEGTPKLAHIKAVTNLIRRGGGKSCLITMSPDFYANVFYEYGFDFIAASQFPRSSTEEIKPEKILNPKDKATIVQGWCNRLGFELNKCVAFGDSMSDYLLFKELEHTVSINGDPILRDLARYQYEGSDLYDAILTICDALLKSQNLDQIES
jgi:phosphoserine phosphatase